MKAFTIGAIIICVSLFIMYWGGRVVIIAFHIKPNHINDSFVFITVLGFLCLAICICIIAMCYLVGVMILDSGNVTSNKRDLIE